MPFFNVIAIEEKNEVKDQIIKYKDDQNLLFLKGPKYQCDICGKEGYTISFCEHCARETLQSKFSTWTSGNDVIDNVIREAQIKDPTPGCIIEWIQYEDLSNVKYFAEGGCSKIYTATWTKGFFEKYEKEKKEFIRSIPQVVILKQLDNSHNPDKEFLKEVILYCLIISVISIKW